MIKILIILCCETLMGDYGYSYLVKDDSKDDYILTMYTKQKHEVGDTIKLNENYKSIDLTNIKK